MKARELTFAPPIAEERLRVMPGIGGIVAPITVVGLSSTAQPLIRVEVPLQHVGEATCFVRGYLAKRDLNRNS